jgi:hypothetical protein
VTVDELARAYVTKASKRRRALEVLLEEKAYSDVVRKAQELVELASRSLPAVAYLCAAINSGRRAEDASRDIECARRRQNHNSHQHGH